MVEEGVFTLTRNGTVAGNANSGEEFSREGRLLDRGSWLRGVKRRFMGVVAG